MAGHSKWANIRARKGIQDARRGKLFTKGIREITVAARSAGGDPAHNPRLRAAIDKALNVNMTRDTIERAIQRGIGDVEGAHYEEIRFEGYGPGGVAVMVDCQTDNHTRTVSEVRHAFTKNGGNLGTDGSVAYLFRRLGVLNYAPGTKEESLMAAAIDAEAEDVVIGSDGSIEVLTEPEKFHAMVDAMSRAGLKPEHAEVIQRPAIDVMLAGEDAEKVWKLIETLEELDDVQHVYSNAHFPDELVQQHAV